MTMIDKTNLTRFPILNLKEELTANRVAKGRHSEYIKFFESHLDDTEYYCSQKAGDSVVLFQLVGQGLRLPVTLLVI